MKKLALILSFLLVPAGAVLAQSEETAAAIDRQIFGCVPLEEKWLQACDLSVTASWKGSFPNYKQSKEEKSCTYNPPPGWVVLETRVSDKRDNNGSYSVNTLAGGLQLMSREELEQSYESLLAEEAQVLEYGGRLKVEERFKAHEKMLVEHSTTHNTVLAKVKASTHGDKFDRKRGWMKMKVDARIVCLGAPSGG